MESKITHRTFSPFKQKDGDVMSFDGENYGEDGVGQGTSLDMLCLLSLYRYHFIGNRMDSIVHIQKEK